MFLGRIEDIQEIIINNNINVIIFSKLPSKINEIINIIKKIDKLNVSIKFIPKGGEILIGNGISEEISGVNLLNIELPLFNKFNLYIKRIFDFAFSFLLILLLIPCHIYFFLFKKYENYNIWNENSN